MSKKLVKSFRTKLKKNTLGIFSKTTDSSIVEIAAISNLDFIILDNEHGFISFETIKNHIRAAELHGMATIVRVPSDSEEYISKALDLGAVGVQIPNVSSASQVKRIIAAAKFHPIGNRGTCKYVRSAEFTNVTKNDFFRDSNDNLLIIQVEGIEGLENIDEILKQSHIDIVFIGPYDLSQSMGLPGKINHPIVIDKMKDIINKAAEANINTGIFCDSLEQVKYWKKFGVKYLSYSVDYGLIMDSFKKIVASK